MGEERKTGEKRKHGQNCDFLCSGPMPNKILICSTDIRGYGMHRSEGEERTFVEAGGVSRKKKLICFHSGLLSPYKFNEIDSLNWYAEQKYRRDESQQ